MTRNLRKQKKNKSRIIVANLLVIVWYVFRFFSFAGFRKRKKEKNNIFMALFLHTHYKKGSENKTSEIEELKKTDTIM